MPRVYLPPCGHWGFWVMYRSKPNISASVGVSLGSLLYSRAQVSLAPSIALRFITQALRQQLLALWNFGATMATPIVTKTTALAAMTNAFTTFPELDRMVAVMAVRINTSDASELRGPV